MAAPRRRSVRWALIALSVLTAVVVVVTGRVLFVVGDGSPDDVGVVRGELSFLGSALEHGAGERMQGLFPEGYFFSNVLYGLALTDLAAGGHGDLGKARTAATRVLGRLASPAGTAVFERGLSPEYGVFYAGWSLLLRAQSAALAPRAGRGLPLEERDGLVTAADRMAGVVRAALDTGASPFLPAYPGRSWPVDTVVAMAALRRADLVTGADHSMLIACWVDRALALADPGTGLLPHETDPVTGRAVSGARGSSQSLIQRFWPLLDPAGAPMSYRRFRSVFLTRRLGVVGVREYPRGVAGGGDVDSGPLLAGLSMSATAVAIGAARSNGDGAVAVSLTHEADVFGVPVRWWGTRRYLLGAVPIADAFLAWARATPYPPPGSSTVVVATTGAPRPWWPVAAIGAPWLAVVLAWAVAVRRGWASLPSGRRGRPVNGDPGGAAPAEDAGPSAADGEPVNP